MAVNPMQRKANNSFLLGMLITLLITGIIIAFLILQVSKLNKEKEDREAKQIYAYIITTDIKSGSEIDIGNVQKIEINNATLTDAIYNANAGFPTGVKAKVDLHPGTVLSTDLTYEDEALADDVRQQEYNVISLPSQLMTGEYIDIRLRLPNGEDYIVVSRKQVTIPTVGGVDSSDCIWINMSEIETVTMSGAIIEAYKAEGSKLYATRYIEAGYQKAATPTYLPSNAVMSLMRENPNLVQEAKNALFTRFNDAEENAIIRNPINNATNSEHANDMVLDGVQQEVQGLKEEREKYLDSLGGY